MDKKKQQEYINKWKKENRAVIRAELPKIYCDIIKMNAAECNKSVTQYILSCIEYYQNAKMLPNFPKSEENDD